MLAVPEECEKDTDGLGIGILGPGAGALCLMGIAPLGPPGMAALGGMWLGIWLGICCKSN